MNQPPPRDDADQLLRDALRAEAEGVEAPHALLERITTESATKRRPTGWLLAAAAVAAVVVGVAAALLVTDDDEPVETIADPTTTTEPEAEPVDVLASLPHEVACQSGESLDFALVAAAGTPDDVVMALGDQIAADPRVFGRRVVDASEIAARIAAESEVTVPAEDATPALVVDVIDPADETDLRALLADQAAIVAVTDIACLAAPEAAPRPTSIALVREDGMLVLVDLETGEQRELHTAGDPRESSDVVEEGGPQHIDGVELSVDGRWVYFSVCCEPVPGTMHRISVTGGEPERIGFGHAPRLNGRFLAVADGDQGVGVIDADTGDAISSATTACCVRSLSWSPDGEQLAAVVTTGAEGAPAEVLLFDWDGTSLTPADLGKPHNPGAHVAWDPNGTVTTISGGGSVDRYRGLSQDASYQWLLWVDDAGVVREQAGLQSGELPEIPDLPRATAADW